MQNLLKSLQIEYNKYKEKEQVLLNILKIYFGNSIDNIEIQNDSVKIFSTDITFGQPCHETYIIPFNEFKDLNTLINPIKYRETKELYYVLSHSTPTTI